MHSSRMRTHRVSGHLLCVWGGGTPPHHYPLSTHPLSTYLLPECMQVYTSPPKCMLGHYTLHHCRGLGPGQTPRGGVQIQWAIGELDLNTSEWCLTRIQSPQWCKFFIPCLQSIILPQNEVKLIEFLDLDLSTTSYFCLQSFLKIS